MPGAQRLHDSAPLDKLLRDHVAERRLYAAICAAPAVALESKGLLKGKKATAHPAFVDKLTDRSAVRLRIFTGHACDEVGAHVGFAAVGESHYV